MNHSTPRGRWTAAVATIGASALAAATLAPQAATAGDVTPRTKQGTVAGVMQHLIELEEIGDAHGGRASGTPGYEASRDYVVKKLRQAGYEPRIQAFRFPYFEETGPSTFERTAPTATTYTEGDDYALMEYSGSGDVTAPVQAVDLNLADLATSTSGCEDADFAGFTAGNIALVRRGTCTFGEKAVNAEEAGAAGVIVMNQGNTPERSGVIAGTLGAPVGIPVIGTTTAIGQELAADGTEVHLVTSTVSEERDTWNVIATTRKGNGKNIVMAGAHLDTVLGANGINDNGSGSAALLETAERLAQLRAPQNKVRFAWWGAEENGLLGSEHYVADLVDRAPERFQRIALYLNFDMVGSPNYMLGVYDGDNSTYGEDEGAAIGPDGSAAIERSFTKWFAAHAPGSSETPFSGRSDYGPFIAENVPAGGLFTGAEGIKTAEQAVLFGGTAGEPYDECYHAECDDLGNVNRSALRYNLGAIMHAVSKYARSTRSVNGSSTGHQPLPEESPRAVTHHRHHRHAGDPVAR